MPRHNIDRQVLSYVEGRLAGLSGTVRYELPEPLVAELRELVNSIHEHLHGKPLFQPSKKKS
jgi:hypothetical protein